MSLTKKQLEKAVRIARLFRASKEKITGNKQRWFNYKTDQHELITMPSDFTDYIPQHDATQNMYKAHLGLGEKPIEAFRKVLYAWILICAMPEELITEEKLERALAILEGKKPLPEGKGR